MARWRGRVACRDGSWLWVEAAYTNRLDDPEHGDVLSELADISNEMSAHDALRAREELLFELAETLPLGVLHVDVTGEVMYANDRLSELVGHDGAATILGRLASVVDEDRADLDAAVRALLERGESHDLRVRFRRSQAGEVRVCAVTMRLSAGTRPR